MRQLLTILVCSVDLIACWRSVLQIKVSGATAVFTCHDDRLLSVLDQTRRIEDVKPGNYG